MTDREFTYWLQGFAELNGDVPPTAEQWGSIREHLALCFNKVTAPVAPVKDGGFLAVYSKEFSPVAKC